MIKYLLLKCEISIKHYYIHIKYNDYKHRNVYSWNITIYIRTGRLKSISYSGRGFNYIETHHYSALQLYGTNLTEL